MRTVRLLVMMCAVMLPARAAAQDTPTRAAQAFFGALMAERWRDAAALVTRESAAESQRAQADQIALVVLYQRQIWVIAEDTLPAEQAGPAMDTTAHMPELSAVAANPAHDSLTVGLLPGVRTLGELRALAPADFLARAWEVTHRAFNPINPADENMGERVAPALIGEVMENDTTAFVVYRYAPPGHGPEQVTEEESVHLMHLRRVDGRWRVLLTSRFEPPLGVLLSMQADEWNNAPGAANFP